MSYILGIDTGGTNTDSVLIDSVTKEIFRSGKAHTTKDNLENGIRDSISKLGTFPADEVSKVCLSTTLATNAIVENKGCKTGIILIGAIPDDRLPTENVEFVHGKIDIRGRERVAISEKEVTEAILRLSESVEAIAVSGYASIRNPEHEQYVLKKIQELTDLPVFCAHQLSGSLGFWERTVTTALNASLIGIIKDFIAASEKVIKGFGIEAPIMIIRSDGTLTTTNVAATRPIETILSGPAASILGAYHLTGRKDALILDMGGTTSDITFISDGHVDVNNKGAKVSNWRTHCQAAEVSTHGIGGDSHIWLNSMSQLVLRPEKVMPLCVAAMHWPYLAEEICAHERDDEYFLTDFHTYDSFVLNIDDSRLLQLSLNPLSAGVVSCLKDGAHSLLYLADKLHVDAESLPIEPLLKEKIIQQISLTPTDLLHASGEYLACNPALSKYVVELLGEILEKPFEEILHELKELVTKQLVYACIQSAADLEGNTFSFLKDPTSMYLLEKAFSQSKEEFLGATFHFDKPIIAVGAPVRAWMPEVVKWLHAQLIIPKHHEITNALGAAVAGFSENTKALIRPTLAGKKYILFLPDQRRIYDYYEDALAYGKKRVREIVADKMQTYGIENIDIEVDVDEHYSHVFSTDTDVYIETTISGISVSDSIIR